MEARIRTIFKVNILVLYPCTPKVTTLFRVTRARQHFSTPSYKAPQKISPPSLQLQRKFGRKRRRLDQLAA
jgi:hypothetical protein